MAVVHRAVEMAIHKAKEHGVAVVGCTNYSSATGALGVWVKKITEAGLVGIVLCQVQSALPLRPTSVSSSPFITDSQCSEMVAPHGSYEPIFGTNPLAIGIPTVPRPQVVMTDS
jgi:L-2-hydroxycarboxylate dehydrogenase (NAD+)